MTDYTMGMQNREFDFFYYTPIKTKLNFQIFKDYSDNISKEPIDETVADLMINVENMITSSSAFKSQENRPVVNHTKWQAYKTKKIPLTSLFMILNKINDNNINEILQETLQYKTFTHQEINQLADVFLGKCIMETKNVNSFINYFKLVMDNMLWYVYDSENKIVSFRDTVIDRLENEYNRLTRIAGHIEDVFKNQIKDETMTNRLEGSEDYLKKKNIILNLINLIGSFYNGQIISTSLLGHILNNLKEQYEGNPNTRKIYLELWLVLWNSVALNLFEHSQRICASTQTYNETVKLLYNENIQWLQKQICLFRNNFKSESSSETKDSVSWDVTRLLTLLENSLNLDNNNIRFDDSNIFKNDIQKNNGLVDEDISLFDLKTDEINKLKNDKDFTKFKNETNKQMINKYIMKYLLSKCVPKSNQENSVEYSNKINMVKKHLINNNEFIVLINKLLEEEDTICEFPYFKKHIKQYIV